MRINGYGLNDNVQAQVERTHAALRTSIRPPEVGIYGSYRKSLRSGVIAAGLVGPLPVWEMRWGASGVMAIIRSLKIQAVASSTAFAATAADSSFSLYRAQGFSAMDTTNGTAGAFTVGKTGANATRFAASQFAGDANALRSAQGGIVILATSASGLTGGTKALDTDPIAIVLNQILASAAAMTSITPVPAPYLIDPAKGPGLQPIELAQNEGLVLNCDLITVTGTWRLMVDVEWDEVDPARYFGLYA